MSLEQVDAAQERRLADPEAPITATAWCSRTSRSTPCSTSIAERLRDLAHLENRLGGAHTLASPPSPRLMRSTTRANGTVTHR